MTLPMFLTPLASLTDDELMRRVTEDGDDRAYGELYHRHARRLMGFLFRQMNGDEALAADLTQDAFMRVWTARNKFSGTNFRTWLLTIGYNLVRNHYRHNEHQKQYELFSKQTGEESADSNIIDQMESDAFDHALRQLLETLPPESRLLFSFRLFSGSSSSMATLLTKSSISFSMASIDHLLPCLRVAAESAFR